jgi:uncharacterized protein YbbK (DUF523 family)
MHLPSAAQIAAWRDFTPEAPLRLLTSACLAGEACGVDGTSYGEYPAARALLGLPNVEVTRFCPEAFAFGVPRATPDIDRGNGFDVLDGRARVMSDLGDDWTGGMLRAAARMAEIAKEARVELALLMDISAACGSTTIYQGKRSLKVYARGPGVAAAAILRAGIPVVSQRDYATLARIFKKLGRVELAPEGVDHQDGEWFRSYFGA